MRRRIETIVAVGVLAVLAGLVPSAPAEESIGTKLKKIFAPTPTPTPRKKKKSTAEKSPTPKPTASAVKSTSPKKKATASPTASETPSPSPSASSKKKKSSPSPSPESSPSASKKKRHKTSPTPNPSPDESPAESASPSPTAEETATPKESPSGSPSPKKKGAPATIPASEIIDYEKYPEHIRNVIDMALELTTRNLDYKYGSADPTSGGMDCSGFVFYVLTQNGVPEVPRDSSQQYVWVRKSGTFKAVNSRHEDTFELDELVPGDLLFW